MNVFVKPTSDAMNAITLVGASVRAAAQSARRAFFMPVAADLYADVDLCETCPATRVEDYPRGLEGVLRGPQAGGWMYTGALENYPDLIDHWSAIRPLYGNCGEVLRRVRDPLQVAQCLRRAGICCPNVAATSADLPRDGSWLRKPLRSAGGVCIERLTNAAADRVQQPVYFQSHVEGGPCSAVYVAARGEAVLLGVTRQLLKENSFRYRGSIGPMPLDSPREEQFAAIGNALAAEFAVVGLFGVDAVINTHEVWPVEVNPRYTASVEVLERSLNLPALALHVAACREGSLPRQLPSRGTPCVGKAMGFAEENLTVEVDLREVLDGVADVPTVGAQIRRQAPVATVLRTGRDEAEVEHALSIALEQLRLNLTHRRDAGPRGDIARIRVPGSAIQVPRSDTGYTV